MGDLVGQAVEGTLYYLPLTEFQRIRTSNASRERRTAIFSDMCRVNALYMIARAGSGHIGSSFSSLDIVSWLMLEEMKEHDVYFSSKGHDAPGYYAALIGTGKLDFELTHKLRQIDGLPGHPDVGTPGMVANTGSLGMGISKAKGMVLANRLKGKEGRVFVMTGDGELQEGQFWESLVSAVNFGLHEITVIIDHNKLQSDTFVKNVSDLGDLEAKLNAFGWRVGRCDGNDIDAFSSVLRSIDGDKRPKVIIADTVKGKGVSFMEHTSLDSDVAMYRFHSGAPESAMYRAAAQELMDRLRRELTAIGSQELKFETVERSAPPAPSASVQRLIPSYTDALLQQAEKNHSVVALDADLILDTGLIPFRERFPDRFIECGIAEQDMVSMAGGMALNGVLPIVHSFACFLSSRPNEQIYNNATEHTKIIYVGSLSGVLPGGPGHSHQSVRDISALGAMPGLTLVEPSCAAEVGPLLSWCVEVNPQSSYLRLTSVPFEVPFALPPNYEPKKGNGTVIREGRNLVVIGYGMVPLSNAYRAAENIAETHDLDVKIINLPWLNIVDPDWLEEAVSGHQKVICLDNHYTVHGQGDIVGRELAKRRNNSTQLVQVGLNNVPPSGTNDQVLKAVGLDVASLERLFISNC